MKKSKKQSNYELIKKERSISLYHQFNFDVDGNIIDIGGRVIGGKLKGYKDLFPQDLSGKSLLDVGCHFGFWCFEAANRGASKVVGLDRGGVESTGFKKSGITLSGQQVFDMNNRVVNEWDRYKNCEFNIINLGKEWKSFGKFDIVMCCSVYHHIYRQAEHNEIFEWLSKHVKPGGYLLWENPMEKNDNVVKKHIKGDNLKKYNKEAILYSASKYFTDVEYIGPSVFNKTRFVYKMSN